jgi:hypothetical protein
LTVQRAWIAVGIGSGSALSFAVVVFAFVGLNPSFSWVPEAPFLLFVGAVVLIDLVTAGTRAARISGSVRDGALAAALAGAIGGVVAGGCYVISGRSAVNLVALPILGALGGAAVGAAAAFLRR